jgi:CMP/dCMP kinase
MNPSMIIAVDGPAGAGKGTLARRLAAHYGFAHLDTGLLYRAVARRVLDAKRDPHDAAAAEREALALTPGELADPALRTEMAGEVASIVSAHPGVRAALLEFQRRFARNPPGGAAGAVLDGRDIGTVVCPEPDVLKLFVTASTEERAQRRFRELLERGESPIYARVLEDMMRRDARDANRSVAPTRAARDAFDLDTTGLDPDTVFARAVAFITSRTRSGG